MTTARPPARQPFSHTHLSRDAPLPRRAGTTALRFLAPPDQPPGSNP